MKSGHRTFRRNSRLIAVLLGVYLLAFGVPNYTELPSHMSRAFGKAVRLVTGDAVPMSALSASCAREDMGAPRVSISAQDLIDEIGVNTHVPYTDGKYSHVDLVAAELKYLGVRQVRDGVSNGERGTAPIESFVKLAEGGTRFTFVIAARSGSDIDDKLKLIERVENARKGAVTAIEGPNEINNEPIDFHGVKDLAGALDMQREIVRKVRADKVLVDAKVVYFTGYANQNIGRGPDPLVAGLADFTNQHPYPKWGEPPGRWLKRSETLVNTKNPNAPAVYTETGYSSKEVGKEVQAKYSLDLIMDATLTRISHIYFYQLMDAYPDNAPQGDVGSGLFTYEEKPKPVAVALHNLIQILKAHEGVTSTRAANKLNYATSGLPRTGCSLQVTAADGHAFIVAWAEPPIWDNKARRNAPAPVSTVSFRPATLWRPVRIYDPMISSGPIRSLSGSATVEVEVSDHPVLIELEPKS